MRHLTVLLALCAVTVVAAAGTGGAAADPEKTGYPNSMASLGDSITQAVNPGPLLLGNQPQYSW